jgi:decaprenyl-phosphate phosphoribosyltransferase
MSAAVRVAWAGAFLDTLRPRQWVKNLLVFAAPAAAGALFASDVLERTGAAFLTFCALASAGYLVNDVIDANHDRNHPGKRTRPIASGVVSQRQAVAGAVTLATIGLAISFGLGPGFTLVATGYLATTTAYSVALKRVAVVDLLLVSACYVIRAVAGAVAVQVVPSTWFLALVSSSALAVVAGRRIANVREGSEDVPATPRERSRVAEYPIEYLRGIWILGLGLAITAYCLWSLAQPHASHGIAWSQASVLPFALAVLRYAYVIERGGAGEPEKVFGTDRVLQIAVVAWFLVYGTGVYLR